MRGPSGAVLVSLAALLAGSACAADDATPPPAELPATAVDRTGLSSVTVEVTDNRFVDQAVVVSPGTEITWVNQGRNAHNVRPVVTSAFAAVTADALEPGGSGSVVFAAPGDFPYYCSIHGSATRGQTGRVIVVGDAP